MTVAVNWELNWIPIRFFFQKAQKFYLEHQSNGKYRDQKVAGCEQEKGEEQKLETENRTFVAVEQNLVEWVPVEVKYSFRVADVWIQLAVEELFKHVLLLHHIIDIFQGLERVRANNSIRFAYESASTYVIDKCREEAIDVVIRQNHFVEIQIRLFALLALKQSVDQLLVEQTQIFRRDDRERCVIASLQ